MRATVILNLLIPSLEFLARLVLIQNVVTQRRRLSWRPRNRMVSGRPRRSPRQGRLSPRGTSSGHDCFLAVKPNQPEEDGEYGVPDVALPNVALPISHRQLPAGHIKSPQSARPLLSGHEREANGTQQDKCRDHRQTFLSSPPTMPQSGPCDYGW